jgi:ABC-2 type transport system ATP-binding protein
MRAWHYGRNAGPARLGCMISCAGLRFSYGRFEAVAGVDLDVGPGELFALLGTNGAGKTSMMDLIRGHLRPSAGTVRVLSRDPARHRRELAPLVGVVPQDSGFAPALTVAETLRLWTRLAGHPTPTTGLAGHSTPMTGLAGRRTLTAWRAGRRTRSIGLGGHPAPMTGLAEVGLEDRAGVAVRHLSGGERRRLDLAVALAGRSSLLLLDEPTTGLDPEARDDCWALIRRRVEEGATVLLTTHYLEEAEAYADRFAILHHGRIAATGARGSDVVGAFREVAGDGSQDPTTRSGRVIPRGAQSKGAGAARPGDRGEEG